MAIIIDLEKERRKRRKTLTNCCICEKVLLAHEVQMIGDDAELFLVCRDCQSELAQMDLKECPECGRGVLFFYGTEDVEKACAICVSDAEKRSLGPKTDPSTPF